MIYDGLMMMKQTELSHWLLHDSYGQAVLKQLQQQLPWVMAQKHCQQVVQLGLPEVDFLSPNEHVHIHRIGTGSGPIVADLEHLPLATESMDLVVLPFVLSQSEHAHAVLREAQRVLCGYGRLLVVDFNPHSLWRCRAQRFQAATGCTHRHALTPRHLADWMQLLGLQPELSRFVNYTPWCQHAHQAQRWQWLEAAGNRWWPHAAAMYAMLAVKQTVYLQPVHKPHKRPESDQDLALNPISVRKPD